MAQIIFLGFTIMKVFIGYKNAKHANTYQGGNPTHPYNQIASLSFFLDVWKLPTLTYDMI